MFLYLFIVLISLLSIVGQDIAMLVQCDDGQNDTWLHVIITSPAINSDTG